jgi:hypothetical protein
MFFKKALSLLIYLVLQKKKAVPGWKTAFFNQGLRRGYPFNYPEVLPSGLTN